MSFCATSPRSVREDRRVVTSKRAEWCDAGRPLPDEGSLRGARRALEVAAATGKNDVLVVLISGGGSALMALPADGISLEAKQQTARTLMAQSADIYELNTVRKHLSGIGWTTGHRRTRESADVGSVGCRGRRSLGDRFGADGRRRQCIRRCRRRPRWRGGVAVYPREVVAHLRRGAAGDLPETPKRGDARLAHAAAYVIGPQRGAIEGARRAAEQRLSRAYRGGAGHRGGTIVRASTYERRIADVSLLVASTLRDFVRRDNGDRWSRQRRPEPGLLLAMAPLLETLGARK